MDSAITAAVVAVPTAVLAAVAAFAGAWAQAKSAYRGPVDAVRRQHQRDAYAAFLAALHAYYAATEWYTCQEQASGELEPGSATAARIEDRTCMVISRVSVTDVMRTGAVVDLEGPEHIAAAATIAVGSARQIMLKARWLIRPEDVSHRVVVVGARDQLAAAISVFVQAARAHLNDFDG
ncbi:hypothetical protein [Streptomyces longwoodensis]|uniref:hypothetical protein n=1 Tax=Streptomyces longwoodensis TaxID=68231 RepID=UPI0033F8E8F9